MTMGILTEEEYRIPLIHKCLSSKAYSLVNESFDSEIRASQILAAPPKLYDSHNESARASFWESVIPDILDSAQLIETGDSILSGMTDNCGDFTCAPVWGAQKTSADNNKNIFSLFSPMSKKHLARIPNPIPKYLRTAKIHHLSYLINKYQRYMGEENTGKIRIYEKK